MFGRVLARPWLGPWSLFASTGVKDVLLPPMDLNAGLWSHERAPCIGPAQSQRQMSTPSFNPGPRPQHFKRWAQIQREQRQKPFYRLLDRSFGFRLLLATASAFALLMAANRWEHCRLSNFESGCLQNDAGGILNVGNVESLSIATAACLYLLEGRKRRQKENLEALEVILAFQQAGAKLSFSRNSALELLSEGGLWLDGLDLSGTILDELNACGARWREVNLKQASLRYARFEDADLSGCNLSDADLSHGDFRHADLRNANLTGANLSHSDLRGADLRDACTDGVQLTGAQLEGAALSGTSLADVRS